MQSSEKTVIPLLKAGKPGAPKFPARNPINTDSAAIINPRELVGKSADNDYLGSMNTVNLLNQF